MADYHDPTEVHRHATSEALQHNPPSSEGWPHRAAITTMAFACLAAVAALLSGLTSHDVLVDRTEEIIDSISSQTDLVRAEVLRSRHAVLAAEGVTPPAAELDEIGAIEAAAADVAADEAAARDRSFADSSTHLVYAVAATLFAVAIALTGLSVIVEMRLLWIGGMSMGVVGIAVLAWGATAA